MSILIRTSCLVLLAFAAGCGNSTPAPQKNEPLETPAEAQKPKPPADPMAEIDKFIATVNVNKSSPDWRMSLRMPPKLTFDPQTDYFWHIDTAAGGVKVKLFADTAPMHASSCLFLNKLGFYDGLNFHRIIPGFMAQGGCPTGTGRDGPGYKFAGEFEGGRKHDRPGLLSMANSGADTDGSQFFLTFAETPWLDGKHTLWGEVVEGMETLKALEKLGTSGGRVSNPPLIKKAWVTAVKKG